MVSQTFFIGTGYRSRKVMLMIDCRWLFIYPLKKIRLEMGLKFYSGLEKFRRTSNGGEIEFTS